jgi:hypothetical protein
MTTATLRLLDVLRASQGNCTDYRVSKLLSLDTAAVSKWRVGKGHMGMANIAKACELAGIPERTWEWQIRIGAEREKGPDGNIYREALRDLEAVQAGGEPSPIGFIALARRLSHVAAILACVLLGLVVSLFPEKQASAADLSVASDAHGFYIIRSWLRAGPRLRRWMRRLSWTWFPVSTFRLRAFA